MIGMTLEEMLANKLSTVPNLVYEIRENSVGHIDVYLGNIDEYGTISWVKIANDLPYGMARCYEKLFEHKGVKEYER